MGSHEALLKKFSLMDIGFSLPVTFTYGKFSVEAVPSYLLPLYSDPLYPEPQGFNFSINAFFKIL